MAALRAGAQAIACGRFLAAAASSRLGPPALAAGTGRRHLACRLRARAAYWLPAMGGRAGGPGHSASALALSRAIECGVASRKPSFLGLVTALTSPRANAPAPLGLHGLSCSMVSGLSRDGPRHRPSSHRPSPRACSIIASKRCPPPSGSGPHSACVNRLLASRCYPQLASRQSLSAQRAGRDDGSSLWRSADLRHRHSADVDAPRITSRRAAAPRLQRDGLLREAARGLGSSAAAPRSRHVLHVAIAAVCLLLSASRRAVTAIGRKLRWRAPPPPAAHGSCRGGGGAADVA